jgi:hypothetical protein
MSLYLENPPNTFSLWSGERLPTNGALYPVGVENSWSTSDLNEIKLFKPADAVPVPAGKTVVSTTVQRVSGLVRYVNTLVNTPTPEPILAGPPVLRASALGLKVIGEDFEGVSNAFNTGGIIYLDVGQYLMFFMEPIAEPYVPIFITDGPHSVSSPTNDEYSMSIEVKLGDEFADPNNLSIQVYQR